MTVSAQEPDAGWPNITFTDVRTGKVLRSISVDNSNGFFHRDQGHRSNIRFHVLRIAGLPDPLILGVAMVAGASDCTYEAIPIGVMGADIRKLSLEPLDFATQGGVYLGKLGNSVDGLSVWYVQSVNDEEHYGPHKYRFKLFRWDRNAGFLEPLYSRTSRRYDTGDQAALAFGLPLSGLIDAATIASWFPDLGC